MTQAYQLGDLGQLLTVDTVGNNITLAANSVVVGTAVINSTSFSGIANNTSFVGTVSAANVVSNAQLSANLSNYQTTAGLSNNVLTLTANNTNFVGTVSAANVVSNAQLTANLANYQTTAGLSNNIASYLPTYAGVVNASSHTVGTAFIANNSQLTITTPVSANGSVGNAGYVLTSNGATGSPYWAFASAGVNVAAQYTWTNTQTFTNTITFSTNILVGTTVNATSYNTGSGYGSATGGFIANSTVIAIGNSTVNVTINSTTSTATVNNASYLGGIAAASYVNTSGSYTLSGNLTFTGANIQFNSASLGNTATNYVNNYIIYTIVGNASYLRFYTYRFATGTDWTSASTRIQQRIDVTDQAYIEFNPNGYSYGVGLFNNTGKGLIVDTNGQPISTSNTFTIGTAAYHVANGNLGLGTSSPAATLDVVGTVNISKANTLQQTLTFNATQTWDTSLGQITTVTLTANVTFSAPSNLKVGTYILHIYQDSTGGRTATWNSIFKWPAGVAPVLTTNASAHDVLSFVSDGTNMYGSFLPNVK
jgi:hypothetical protein